MLLFNATAILIVRLRDGAILCTLRDCLQCYQFQPFDLLYRLSSNSLQIPVDARRRLHGLVNLLFALGPLLCNGLLLFVEILMSRREGLDDLLDAMAELRAGESALMTLLSE